MLTKRVLRACSGNDIEADGFHRCCDLSRLYSIDDDHDEEQGVRDMPGIGCMGGGDTLIGDK